MIQENFAKAEDLLFGLLIGIAETMLAQLWKEAKDPKWKIAKLEKRQVLPSGSIFGIPTQSNMILGDDELLCFVRGKTKQRSFDSY